MRSAVLTLALLASTAAEGAPGATLVLRGGQVYTVDAARTWASAVVIKDGRIVYVGDDRGAAPFAGRGARVLELEGRMVLPGFHDSHMHPVTGGLRLIRCKLGDATSRDQLFAAVRACAAALPGAGTGTGTGAGTGSGTGARWLVGNGWDPRLFAPSTPLKSMLDELVPDRPAYLATADGFTAWVNTAALRSAAIDGKTADPPGGRIDRDTATGEPTGILRDAAVDLVRRKIPPAMAAEYREGLRCALAMANRFGITSLIDGAADQTVLEHYLAADRAGELTVRVVASQRVDSSRGVEQVGELIARRDRYRSSYLRAGAAKLFLDGEFGSFTAALLEPYSTRSDTRGALKVEPDAVAALVRRLDAEGFQVQMHVVGDRAVRVALDAFAGARAANGASDRRHQLAHLELIDPVDLPRFRRLGVTASIQPLLGFADGYLGEVAPLLGPERARRLFPYASLLSSGAAIAAGSDWPAPSMNPLEVIQAALTRCPLDGCESPWEPGQTLRLPEMISAYTIGGAWLARSEKVTGSIEVGKSADLLVLDRNVFDVPPSDLRRVRVLLTLLEGRPVYRDPVTSWPLAQ